MALVQHFPLEGSRSFLDLDAGVHRDVVRVNRSDQIAAVDVGYALVAAAVGSVVADVAVAGSAAASLGAGTRGVAVVAVVVAASLVAAVAVVDGPAVALVAEVV